MNDSLIGLVLAVLMLTALASSFVLITLRQPTCRCGSSDAEQHARSAAYARRVVALTTIQIVSALGFVAGVLLAIVR